MVERYENIKVDMDVGPSPFERASSHGALPRTSSVEQTTPEGPVLTHSGELARRRLPGHKRASSLSDLSRYCGNMRSELEFHTCFGDEGGLAPCMHRSQEGNYATGRKETPASL